MRKLAQMMFWHAGSYRLGALFTNVGCSVSLIDNPQAKLSCTERCQMILYSTHSKATRSLQFYFSHQESLINASIVSSTNMFLHNTPISWNSCVHPLILHFAPKSVFLNHDLTCKIATETQQESWTRRSSKYPCQTGPFASVRKVEIVVRLSIIPSILTHWKTLPCYKSVNLSKWVIGELFILKTIKGYQMKKTNSTLKFWTGSAAWDALSFAFVRH